MMKSRPAAIAILGHFQKAAEQPALAALRTASVQAAPESESRRASPRFRVFHPLYLQAAHGRCKCNLASRPLCSKKPPRERFGSKRPIMAMRDALDAGASDFVEASKEFAPGRSKQWRAQ